MPNVLPGYTWDKARNRYRDQDTGRFVSRDRITQLLDQRVNAAEARLNALTAAYQSGKLAPSVWSVAAREELKTIHLQHLALAKGGWDRLTQQDYGRAGAALRQLYPKIAGSAADIANGAVSPAQMANRISDYVGSARALYHQAEREQIVPAQGSVTLERRILDPSAAHCGDCVDYANRGWQVLGTLPVPGQACRCRGNCRCSMAYMEVPANEVNQWIGREAATMADEMETEQMSESGELSPAFVPLVEKALRRDGTIPIKIIKPGWGSSGYYPADVLERAAGMFQPGLQMFWDHQTASEEAERPEGTLNNLAAVLTSGATWNANGPAGPGLYADAKVFPQYQESIDALAPHIGVSIRAAGRAMQGEAEGRKGLIVQSIAQVKSVDFVTKPGAGGQILQLFEAARTARPEKQEKEMQELEEAKATIAEQAVTIARLTEALLVRDAREFVTAELAKATLPAVTKARLVESLSANPPVVDGKLDKATYATKVSEAITAETAYLREAAGYTGQIRDMGTATQPTTTETAAGDVSKRLEEAFAGLGLSGDAAKFAAAGRR